MLQNKHPYIMKTLLKIHFYYEFASEEYRKIENSNRSGTKLFMQTGTEKMYEMKHKIY